VAKKNLKRGAREEVLSNDYRREGAGELLERRGKTRWPGFRLRGEEGIKEPGHAQKKKKGAYNTKKRKRQRMRVLVTK